MRLLNTSRMAASIVLARIGRRRFGGRVSGWRSMYQPTEKLANSMKATKIARQPPIAITPAPMVGASAGKRVKIIMTKDVILAISRPE